MMHREKHLYIRQGVGRIAVGTVLISKTLHGNYAFALDVCPKVILGFACNLSIPHNHLKGSVYE